MHITLLCINTKMVLLQHIKNGNVEHISFWIKENIGLNHMG